MAKEHATHSLEAPVPLRQPTAWRMRALLVCCATLVALACAEIGLRFSDPHTPVLRFQQLGSQLANDPRAQFMDLIESDPELFWRLTPNVRLARDLRPFYGLISNSQGLREERDIPAVKGGGELRILFLGDSCTFGYLLRAEQSFVQVAEDRLRKDFPNTPIECINAGVPGYSLFQGWRFLETRGRSLQPDLVVFNFGWNDGVSWDGLSDYESYRRLTRQRPPSFLAHSALARKLWSLSSKQPSSSGARPRLTPDEFAALLAQCVSSARNLGAESLVLVGGSRLNLRSDGPEPPLSEYQKQQFQFAKTLHLGPADNPALVDGVEVARRLAQEQPIEALFLDAMHPSAGLNQALGEALVLRLTPWLRGRGAH